MHKEDCIAYIGSYDWEEWDGSSNFLMGFALVRRSNGHQDYVVVKTIGEGGLAVIKDFSDNGSVVEFLQVFSNVKREKTKAELETDFTPFISSKRSNQGLPFDISQLNTKQACVEYLRAMGKSELIKGRQTRDDLFKIIKELY